MLAKGCAICLVLLVISPVTAPFRTLDDLVACGASHAAAGVPAGRGLVSLDDAALTNEPMIGKSIRFGGVISLTTVSGVVGALLPTAGMPPLRAPGATAARSHVSPVLRI